jgi:hypothetical protein
MTPTTLGNGAVTICVVLQSYISLLGAARAGKLPSGVCHLQINGKELVEEHPIQLLCDLEKKWTERARLCTMRPLTNEELVELEKARELFEWFQAARGEGVWLDLLEVVEEADTKAKEQARLRRVLREG